MQAELILTGFGEGGIWNRPVDISIDSVKWFKLDPNGTARSPNKVLNYLYYQEPIGQRRKNMQ
jgi:hypothetical protein